jgi:hypothetical protein
VSGDGDDVMLDRGAASGDIGPLRGVAFDREQWRRTAPEE